MNRTPSPAPGPGVWPGIIGQDHHIWPGPGPGMGINPPPAPGIHGAGNPGRFLRQADSQYPGCLVVNEYHNLICLLFLSISCLNLILVIISTRDKKSLMKYAAGKNFNKRTK